MNRMLLAIIISLTFTLTSCRDSWESVTVSCSGNWGTTFSLKAVNTAPIQFKILKSDLPIVKVIKIGGEYEYKLPDGQMVKNRPAGGVLVLNSNLQTSQNMVLDLGGFKMSEYASTPYYEPVKNLLFWNGQFYGIPNGEQSQNGIAYGLNKPVQTIIGRELFTCK